MSGNDQRKPASQGLDHWFGHYGRQTQLYQLTWRSIDEAWELIKAHYANLTLNEALEASMERSGFWFHRLMLAKKLGAFSRSECSDFWEKFREIFKPCLSPEKGLSELRALRVGLMGIIKSMMDSEPLRRQYNDLKKVSYSTFSEQEIDCLLGEKYRPIVEIGCGTGYLLAEINSRGGDAMGIDNDQQILALAQDRPDEFPWIFELLQPPEPRLIIDIDSIDRLKNYAGRTTLVSSCPLPGSSYPADALEAFGGTYFVFKPGIFVSRWRTDQSHDDAVSTKPGKNIRRLFYELLLNWQEVPDAPDRPKYDPRALGNNPWFFQRRPRD